MSVSRPMPWWQVAGIVFAVLVAVAGLAIVAVVVLFMIAMANWGSNK
jgi:hypothetical protein